MAEAVHLEGLAHEIFIGGVLQKHSILIIRCIKVTHPRVAPAGLSVGNIDGKLQASRSSPHHMLFNFNSMHVGSHRPARIAHTTCSLSFNSMHVGSNRMARIEPTPHAPCLSIICMCIVTG